MDAAVGQPHPDLAEADDAEGLAGDFVAAEGRLLLFDLGADLVRLHLGERAAELDAGIDIAFPHPDHREHQIDDRIGVGAGGVEDADPLLGGAVDIDVVDPGPGPGDGEQRRIVVDIDRGTADQDALGIGLLGGNGIVVAEEPEPFPGDGIDPADFESGHRLLLWFNPLYRGVTGPCGFSLYVYCRSRQILSPSGDTILRGL